MLLIRDVKQPCSSPVVAEPKFSEELPSKVQLMGKKEGRVVMEEVMIAPVKAFAVPSILLWLKSNVLISDFLVELVSPCRTKAPWGTAEPPVKVAPLTVMVPLLEANVTALPNEPTGTAVKFNKPPAPLDAVAIAAKPLSGSLIAATMSALIRSTVPKLLL